MRRLVSVFFLVAWLALLPPARCWGNSTAPIEGFVQANGVRLQYLDWGNSGPALILLHGLGENPHKFDDIAPAFADQHHVIAYARRGQGNSESAGPYDVGTLTEDLRSLMDALGIAKADFAGHSAGGNEITELAVRYPQRVGRIVYLEAGYDWADADFRTACSDLPLKAFSRPADAMTSWEAYRQYQKVMWYPGLDDMRRIEASLRENVVIQPDKSIQDRTPQPVLDAHLKALWSNEPRHYTRVHSPVLAFYAEHMYEVSAQSSQLAKSVAKWEQKYWTGFQEKSIARVRRELPDARIIRVPGSHTSFFLTDREQVVAAMRQFFAEPGRSAKN